jgi:hypothetical protein
MKAHLQYKIAKELFCPAGQFAISKTKTILYFVDIILLN